MTHKSNFDNVFWHIDSMRLLSNDLYEVSGWIFSTEGSVKKIITILMIYFGLDQFKKILIISNLYLLNLKNL